MGATTISADNFQQRADLDFLKRAAPGNLIYLIAWPLLFIPNEVHEGYPILCWSITLAFVTVSILRLAHAKQTPKFYHQHQTLWQYSLLILALTHAALWGSVFVLANHHPGFSSIQTSVNLVTAGISTAAIASLTPKPRLANWYISILLLPSALLTLFDPENWYLAVIIIAFWVYLLFVSRRFNAEYQRAFNIEQSLIEKQKELSLLSQTDSLTKVFNRLFFNEHLSQEWHLSQRNNSSLALIMIDIDHFKTINDKHGHVFGDECLIFAADIIKQTVKRKSDMVCRYGGEEFAVILPETTISAATKIAESIRLGIEKQEFHYDQKSQKLTASFGVGVVTPKQDDDPLCFVSNTDEALYLAKRNGRNRVELYNSNNKQQENPL